VSREYPDRPFVGIGAVIVDEGRVVLVRRRFEPLAGRWSLPGGLVELGEPLERTVRREMIEETGLDVVVGPVVEVFDRIMRDEADRIRYHYVLIDYLCWPAGGALRPGSDVDDAALVPRADLPRYDLTAKAVAVIDRALELAREPGATSGRRRRGPT
jgi:ADP-ribose pyrophosphatase YjhB (NUDIX family)